MPGASARMRSASAGESGSTVSTHTDSAWPTTTGTLTQLALRGRSGSSRILRVSSRSLTSSSNSRPSKLPVHAELVVVGILGSKVLDRVGAGARDRLVGGDAHASQTGGVLQRREHHGQRDRAAVRVRDDARVLEGALAVDLGHHERDALLQAERGRLVDAEGTGCRCDRHELPAPLRADREEADVQGARRQRANRRLLDLEVAEESTRGAPRGERADVRVATIHEVLERDPTDGAGCADDADTQVRVDHRLSVKARARMFLARLTVVAASGSGVVMRTDTVNLCTSRSPVGRNFFPKKH